MLRVGLTGSLGSGKTTIAAIFREHGIHVLEADTIARAMMQPGQASSNTSAPPSFAPTARWTDPASRPWLSLTAVSTSSTASCIRPSSPSRNAA